MFSFNAVDIHHAVYQGLTWLLDAGVEEESRNGKVLVAPGPVCTTYLHPEEHVLLSPTRDANPFFHMMEALWMLSGNNAIEFPCFFNKGYSQFSDDGRTMWDAYGWRWRSFFGWDQVSAIVKELSDNPSSRRCVLAMWSPRGDSSFIDEEDGEVIVPSSKLDDFYVATHGGRAVPCNTHAYFDLRKGKLNMTVCNRSNDVIWGAYGANAVHFSILLQYMAMRIGVPVGVYRQFSNNFHVYLNTFDRDELRSMADECESLVGEVAVEDTPPMELTFDSDLTIFMTWANKHIADPTALEVLLNVPDFQSEYFYSMVSPMFLTWAYRKSGDPYSAGICADGIRSTLWRKACQEWIERRKK